MDMAGDARASPAGLGDPAAAGKFPYSFAKSTMGSSTAPALVRSVCLLRAELCEPA